MSEWITRENVEILNVFRKLPANYHHYLIQFRMPEPDKPLGESRHTINIWETDLKGQLKGVLDGTRERSYLAFGNQDIDIYKNKEGKFAIRHSPTEGLNLVLILADGQMEKLVEELSADDPYPFLTELQAAGVAIEGPKEQIRVTYKSADNRSDIDQLLFSKGFKEIDSKVEGETVVSTWERLLKK